MEAYTIGHSIYLESKSLSILLQYRAYRGDYPLKVAELNSTSVICGIKWLVPFANAVTCMLKFAGSPVSSSGTSQLQNEVRVVTVS